MYANSAAAAQSQRVRLFASVSPLSLVLASCLLAAQAPSEAKAQVQVIIDSTFPNNGVAGDNLDVTVTSDGKLQGEGNFFNENIFSRGALIQAERSLDLDNSGEIIANVRRGVIVGNSEPDVTPTSGILVNRNQIQGGWIGIEAAESSSGIVIENQVGATIESTFVAIDGDLEGEDASNADSLNSGKAIYLNGTDGGEINNSGSITAKASGIAGHRIPLSATAAPRSPAIALPCKPASARQ